MKSVKMNCLRVSLPELAKSESFKKWYNESQSSHMIATWPALSSRGEAQPLQEGSTGNFFTLMRVSKAFGEIILDGPDMDMPRECFEMIGRCVMEEYFISATPVEVLVWIDFIE